MGTNLQDYVDLLNAEQHVPVEKIRENARHGVAPSVRGEVWMYLLAVLSPDKTQEISSILNLINQYQTLPTTLPSHLTSILTQAALSHHTRRFFNPTYAGLISSLTAESASLPPINSEKTHTRDNTGNSTNAQSEPKVTKGADEGELNTIRSQYSRFLPPPPSTPPSRSTFISTVLEVLGKYHNTQLGKGRDMEKRRSESGLNDSESDWVYLVTPFVCCLSRPGAIYLGFEKLMDRMESFPPLPSRLASLLTLFRLAIPDLHSYFEDEQVPYVGVTISWLTTLLAREMWLGDVLRLWDAYLSSSDMFELHCYVCVAILGTCKETLEELDGSEAKLMLLDLPPMDVDRLLQDAANLRVSFPLPRPVEEE